MEPCEIGSGFDVLGGNAIVEIIVCLFLNHLLWRISHKYKSRESNVINSYESVTQRQQLSIYGHSCLYMPLPISPLLHQIILKQVILI